MTGRLVITDGTTIVNLFNQETRGAGFYVVDWVPQASPLKDGGTWQTSPFSQGRQLVSYEWGNTVDAFTLGVNGADQDAVTRDTQKLRRLLVKALNYAVNDWQGDPVWVEARGASETEIRYALIKGFEAPGDANPFASPYANQDVALLEDFALVLEHDPWGHVRPGLGECLPLSGEVISTSTETDGPTAQADDAYITSSSPGINTGGAQLFFGNAAGVVYDAGVRFRGVAVPQGAVILSAQIEFVASSNSINATSNLILYGEDADSAAGFTNKANFLARTRTSAYVPWSAVPTWATGQKYLTPDLTGIVQEIVSRAGWVSGNDLVIFVQDNASDFSAIRAAAALDNAVYREPRLTITYQLAQTLGREATCENEVYVANKQNTGNLTHVFHYDASGPTYSSNLMNATPPFDLLPAVPAVGDILYLGSSDGPFPSAVFDLLVTMVDVKAVAYEYYNGAWTTLTVQDNTRAAGSSIPFTALGVGSMHWEQPSDWTTTTINGATCYWVRVRVTGIDAGPIPPTQGNRLPYAIVVPYVEIAATEVKGDLPARAKVTLNNQADGTNAPSALTINVDWVLTAVRSVSRGALFTPFLNCADEQNPVGLTVTAGTNTSFVTNITTPTGRAMLYNPVAVEGLDVRATLTLDSALFRQYTGTFRAFARVRQTGGSAGAINVRLRVASNNANYVFFTSPTLPISIIAPSTSAQWELLDFGSITLPNKNFSSYLFLLDAENTDATPRDLYLCDLILMPVDECAVEASEALNSIEGMLGYFDTNRKLVVDSLSNPRRLVEAELRKQTDDTVISFYIPVPENLFRLQQGARQRVYFLSWNQLTKISFITTAYSVQMERVHQYLSARGAE